ncbi:protein FAR1-RELATED SEQUENCE 5-like [Arachis duranensis]|uniref:Protein FAR1-RELATED SEQUENCE 5-like n=1 Tax=Arachis duranensis TaxID=130453 RepID=A0A6P4DEL0_ARADU|nr:protein FAR1-RELATED SEQUENCE 5-like [Arachis duranensis]
MAESGYEMLDEEAGYYGEVLQLSKEEIMSKAFRSDEAAYEFYRRFGKYFGFGIRKGDSGKDESGRVIRRRFFVTERAYGVLTSKILGHITGQASGYSLKSFTKKDAYNYINKVKHAKIIDGDSNAVVVYLEGKAGPNSMSMARYNVTKDNTLANIFWADGGSRVDYQYFGDVLTFNLTYKKNKYRRPLVIFSGVNNHKQTTIFGFGLVLDESVGSDKWLLENLLEVMCNKKSTVVVTDGCDSMKATIKSVFPEATHRFYAWHMEKNVTANVKEEKLRQCFTRWLYSDMEIDEFEAEWDDTVEEYGFQNSFWAKETFQKRMMWANVYLRDKFCAGFRTTSRCEGINVYVKNFLKSRHSILDMVQNLGLVMREYQNNKLLAQFRSLHGIPVMTTCLDPLEKYAVDVYTHWRNTATQHEHLTQIPERLVLKRWRKDAKSLDKYVEITEFGSKRGFLQRHGALHTATQWMLYVGARCPSSFTHVLNEDEIPVATGCSETMEYDRNMRSSTDELLTQCKTGYEASIIIVSRISISLEISVSLYYNCALRYLFSKV